MGLAPLRVCNRPGCRQLTRERFCSTCKSSENQRRGSASERGYGHKWREYRLGFLRKNPLCVLCLAQNRTAAATVVDHKTPHRGDDTLFWDPKNHQAICKPCHDHKTATEDGGFGRPRHC